MLGLNLISAPLKEALISSRRAGDLTQHIQKPRKVAHDTNEAHMVMHSTDNGVRIPCGKIAKVPTESDVSHDIEGEKHGPGGRIERFSLIGFDLRYELLRLRYDTGFVDLEGFYVLVSSEVYTVRKGKIDRHLILKARSQALLRRRWSSNSRLKAMHIFV